MFNINSNLIAADNCFVFIGLLRTGASPVPTDCRYILYHISQKLSYISDNLTAAASHRPTLWDVKFTFTGDRTFSLPCKGRWVAVGNSEGL